MTEVAKHFRREEAIIAAMGFPDAPAHFEMHRALLSKATQLLSAFEAGTLEVGALFQFLAQDMVAAHILGADRLFFPYLESGDRCA